VRRVPTERGDYGAFYAEVARAIRAEGPTPVDVDDAISMLEVIEAARLGNGRPSVAVSEPDA
jgi:scyllo-inositol 2-dehydrogenase (NADP+)